MALHGKQVPNSSTNNRAARSAHARARQEFKTYDTSAIRPKRSKTPFIALAVIIVCVIVSAIVLVRACTPNVTLLSPDQEAVVKVNNGEGAKNIAESLVDAHLIESKQAFIDLVNRQGAAASLIPGTYVFHGGISPDEILNALLAGPSSTADTLTIPEGFTRAEIAQRVQEATNSRVTEQQFLEASADAAVYVQSFPFLESAGNNSLEGFLFPKTYAITAGDDAKSIVVMMLSQFRTETADIDWSYPQSLGLSLYQIVNLASIVQKEGIPENFGDIAGVFYNRLKSDRPYLESDATTAYEVGRSPTKDEVHADTPYSTYTHEGLPPTPICNPSLAALMAVASPTETDYMFFYTHPDGSFTFSRTYEEHQESYS